MTVPTFDFTDRRVIVTGAGAGIGEATALAFLAAGARVVAVDLSADRLAALALAAGESRRLVTHRADLAAPGAAADIAALAGGTVDVLVNNAGIMDGFEPLGEYDDATWERVMAVNVTALMRLSRAVLPGMVAAGKGVIVNVASEAGLRGACAGVAYTASKHAVVGITRNTAVMYGPKGIRCNAVAPGAVKTSIEAPFRSALGAERIGALLGAVVPPAAMPGDIAAAILFLASDAAANVNGAILPSDGGWSAI